MAIDINNATAEELIELDGINAELAEVIIAHREENGPFSSLDELADIPGCDEQLVMRLRAAGANVGASTTDMRGQADL